MSRLQTDSSTVIERRSAAAAEATGHTRASSGAPAVSAAVGSASTVGSPMDALRADEFDRSRSLALAAFTLVAGAALAMPVLGGDPIAIRVMLVSLAVVICTNTALLYLLANPARYTARANLTVWSFATLAALGVIYYFGALSGAVAIVLLGLYIAALGHDARMAGVVYATIAAGHGAMCLAIAFNVLDDRGLLTSEHFDVTTKVVSTLLLQVIYACAFLLARRSRQTTLKAVEDLHSAVRALAQREVLLEEARQDFARAVRIGGPGRLTGARAGRFELGVILGRGAMGEVYEARAPDAGTIAAVKVLLPAAGRDPGSLSRFLREIETASALDSPHVVRVLEVGDETAPFPFLAMERLYGSDLSSYLRDRRRLELVEVIELVRQVGRGLTAAAGAGIVHRDLKPQNLFRAELGGAAVWKILDFGVSKLEGRSGTLTQGNVVGTPSYMAPEQARGGDVDHRADLYALGAIAYRCLTGRPPFAGKDVASILYGVVHVMPPPPSTVAELPRTLDPIFARALAKAPAARYPDATALAAALANAL